jgi:hypothetical protein
MRWVSLLVVVAACADPAAPPPAVDAALDAPGPDAVPSTGRLTVVRHGDGLVTGGTSTPTYAMDLIDCGARCGAEVADGEFVTLYGTAAPDVTVTVTGPCTVANCQFIMDGPTTVTFTFTPR